MSGDNCPSCGEAWEGECPKDPWYVVYECGHCGRVEADNFGEREVVQEREFSLEQMAIIEALTRGEEEEEIL